MKLLHDQTTAQQIAEAASAFERRRSGFGPQSVSVVVSGDILVVTLHSALSRAEKAMTASAAGAAQVQEEYRQLFLSSSVALREDIERITGVKVCEAATEVEADTGNIVQVFTNGARPKAFLFAHGLSAESSVENRSAPEYLGEV